MDGIAQAIGGMLGPAASAPAPLWQQLLTGGLFGAGELGNLLQQHKQDQYQNQILSLVQNPAKLTQYIQSLTQPLSNSLVQTVNNRVQGDLAQRGLSQAPGIFGGTEAQALAPFVMQNQQSAQDLAMRALGLPAAATNINAPPSNLSPALQMFLRSFGTPGANKSSLSPAWNTNQSAPAAGITLPGSGGGAAYGVPPGGSTPSYFPDTTDWGFNSPTIPTFSGGS